MLEILPNFHPIFVHFTVALFSVATALFIVILLAQKKLPEKLKEQFWIVAHWNLWLAAGITLITVLAGHHAYNTVAHDGPSHAAMTDHRNWAIIAFILIISVASWAVYLNQKKHKLNPVFIGILLVTQAVLLSTAWRGGELVYRYGLGVLSLPTIEISTRDHHADVAHDAHDIKPSTMPTNNNMYDETPHDH